MSHKAQMVFDDESYRILQELKEMLEADSWGEIVRRALLAEEQHGRLSPPFADTARKYRRIQVVLPDRSKSRLERLATTDISHAGVIRKALRTLEWCLKSHAEDISKHRL